MHRSSSTRTSSHRLTRAFQMRSRRRSSRRFGRSDLGRFLSPRRPNRPVARSPEYRKPYARRAASVLDELNECLGIIYGDSRDESGPPEGMCFAFPIYGSTSPHGWGLSCALLGGAPAMDHGRFSMTDQKSGSRLNPLG